MSICRVTAAVLACLILAGCGRPPRTAQRPITHLSGLTVHFLDVGQGDATLLQWEGRSALIDGGPPDLKGRLIASLRKHHVSRLDWVIATHPHAAHIGGLADVLRSIPVGTVLDTGYDAGSASQRDFLRELRERKVDFRIAEEDQTIDLGAGLALFLFAPPEPFLQGTPNDVNNNSLVARLMYGKTRILFAGDMGGEERRVVYSHLPANFEAAKALRADALLVPDHGSGEAMDAEFLQFVQPKVAVISCGAGNAAGDPQAGALDALRAAKVRTFRTDRQGEITLASDGETLKASTAHAPVGDLWTPGKSGIRASTTD